MTWYKFSSIFQLTLNCSDGTGSLMRKYPQAENIMPPDCSFLERTSIEPNKASQQATIFGSALANALWGGLGHLAGFFKHFTGVHAPLTSCKYPVDHAIQWHFYMLNHSSSPESKNHLHSKRPSGKLATSFSLKLHSAAFWQIAAISSHLATCSAACTTQRALQRLMDDTQSSLLI